MGRHRFTLVLDIPDDPSGFLYGRPGVTPDEWDEADFVAALDYCVLHNDASFTLENYELVESSAGPVMFEQIEAFYAAEPKRQRSPEVDYGVMWWADSGRRWPHYRVSWVEATGEFYAVKLLPRMGGDVELLGATEPGNRELADKIMEGWANLDSPMLGFVRHRLTTRAG